MGALHEGHLELIRRSAADNDVTVVTVFVNATQFNDPTDLAAYPRTLDDDVRLAASAGADVVLAPAARRHLPGRLTATGSPRARSPASSKDATGPATSTASSPWCSSCSTWSGRTRAYFGEKDYQQYLLVRGMVEALLLPRRDRPVSHRPRRGRARPELAQHQARRGRARDAPRTCRRSSPRRRLPVDARHRLEAAGFEVDYVEDAWGRRFGAVVLDGVRLIDNIPLPGSDR